MTLTADLYWSLRSPYSYLILPRVEALVAEWDLDVEMRFVYPIAVRAPDFFQRIDPLWPRYLMKDVYRTADFLDLAFKWPDPDPVVMDMKTRTIPADQPYIHRLTRLGIEAERRGAAMAFAREVSRTIWDGRVTHWHEGDHLARSAAAAGLDLADMDATLDAGTEFHDRRIAENADALQAAGHWGVPTVVFEGEPFFGQDRLDMAVWRMRQKGLEARKG